MKATIANLTAALAALPLLLAAAAAPASQADEYYEDALGYLEQGKGNAAVIQLKNALQSDPTHVESRLALGEIQLQLRDADGAAKEFGRARDLGAPTEAWMPGLVRAQWLQRDWQGVIDTVELDDTLTPQQQAALLSVRGTAHQAQGDRDAALSDFEASLVQEPGNAPARLGIARLTLQSGDAEAALAQASELLVDHPEHVETLLFRGNLLQRLRRFDEASADFAEAARLAPRNAAAYQGMAAVSLSVGDPESARGSVARLQELAPENPQTRYLAALLAYRDGDYAAASDQLQLMLRAAPNSLRGQLLYGLFNYAQEQYTLADDYLSRVLSSAPGNMQVRKMVAATRLKLREPRRAIDVLEPVVDLSPEDAQLFAMLGTAHLQIGDNSQGAEYIQRAVDIDPEQAKLRTQLAFGRLAAGDTDAAISELETAVALDQDVLQADVLLVLGYLNKQQYRRAMAAAEALEQRMPDSPIPYNLTGLAFLAQRQVAEAEARFATALEKDPDFDVARMNLARTALADGRPADAAAVYRQVVERNPENVNAMLALASLARADGDPDAARDWVERAHSARPLALQPILVLAELDLRNGEPLKALNRLNGLASEQARLPAVLRLRGMAQLQAGDAANAAVTFERLVEQRPDEIEGWFQLARAQAMNDDADGARRSFNRAIELDTGYQVPLAWAALAELEMRERRYDAALDVGRRIQTHFPDSPLGHDIEASAYRAKGVPAEALAAAETALRTQPTSRRANTHASLLAAAGQPERAIEVLESWLEQSPGDAGASTRLGMLYQQLGRDDEALAAYQAAAAGAPQENALILNNMAWLYLGRDDARAVQAATRAYELAPTRAEVVDTYGWVLFQTGERQKGLAALQQALVIAPRNAEIALHVGEALASLERADEARQVLEGVVRDHPGSEHAASARALLDRLQG